MVVLEIEIETKDGKRYKQPDCRIKTTAEGYIMMLIKNNDTGKWQNVKGKVFIKQLKLKKEFYIYGEHPVRIPNWLIKLFGVKV